MYSQTCPSGLVIASLSFSSSPMSLATMKIYSPSGVNSIKLILELRIETSQKLNSVLEKTARLYILVTLILSFSIVS